MAQIYPDSDIILLTGVPLDLEGRNTLYFTNPAQQETWFKGKTLKTYTKYSYQRKGAGIISVDAPYAQVMRANYVMFRNSAYENKWFYAFVLGVDYVNDRVCTIRYRLDAMQTWLMDYQMLECFVERQHSATDEPGDSITPEPIELGEAVYRGYRKILDLSDCVMVIGAMDYGEHSAYYNGRMYDGVFSGVELYAVDNATNANYILGGYSSRPADVITMYMIPRAAVPSSVSDLALHQGQPLPDGSRGRSYQIALPETPEAVDGYTPRNKKLLTYPYTYLHIDNGQGNALALRWEFFQSTPVATISTTITQPVRASLTPSGYKGAGTEFLAERLDLGGFPVCSWRYNSYGEWVANQGVPTALSTLQQATAGIASAYVSGGPAGLFSGAMTAISGVTSLLSTYYKSSLVTDTCGGTLANGGNLIGARRQAFYGGQASVTAQQAQVIDDFFTMFGYAVNRVTTPDIHARSRYTYVKTQGCNISATFPVEDAEEIRRIFDSGVTFWDPAGAVGDYSQENTPLGRTAAQEGGDDGETT